MHLPVHMDGYYSLLSFLSDDVVFPAICSSANVALGLSKF